MLPTIATGNVASALAGEYEVANSLRFDDGSSDYLQISSSSGSNTTGTFSAWIKRGNLSSTQCPIGVAVDGNNFINIQYNGFKRYFYPNCNIIFNLIWLTYFFQTQLFI